jgi:hypothetical protein
MASPKRSFVEKYVNTFCSRYGVSELKGDDSSKACLEQAIYRLAYANAQLTWATEGVKEEFNRASSYFFSLKKPSSEDSCEVHQAYLQAKRDLEDSRIAYSAAFDSAEKCHDKHLTSCEMEYQNALKEYMEKQIIRC